jgi:preprotein translocase subunit SecB
MAKEKNNNTETTEQNSTEQAQRQITVNAQYVKDISFENPDSPNSLLPSEEKPNINVSVDVAGKPLGNTAYEVALRISAAAKRGEKTSFVAEVTYAGVFNLIGIPEGEVQPALLIYCPSLLFPFARRIIADLTRDGGFPPLMLDPIDFGRLYMQRMEQLKAEQQKA